MTMPSAASTGTAAAERTKSTIASTAPFRITVVPVSIPLNLVWRRKGNELCLEFAQVATANTVFLFCQHHDRAAFRRLIGERRELRRIGEFLFAPAGERDEFRRLPVAERDRAGLVEKQRVDVPRRLHRAPRHRENIEPHKPVHPRDPDRRQKRPDRRRNERDEKRDENNDADRAAGVIRKARNGRDRKDEDER